MPGNVLLSSCCSRAQHDQLLCGGGTDTVSSCTRELCGDGAYLVQVESSIKSSYNTECVLGFYKMNFAHGSIKYKTMRPLQLQLQTNKYVNIKTASYLSLLPLTYGVEKPTLLKYYF